MGIAPEAGILPRKGTESHMPILITVTALLALATLLLLYKVVLLKRAMREIREQVRDRIDGETSASMRLTTSDKEAVALAESLDHSLSDLNEERQKLIQGDRNLRKNITAISHDIRTPLTAIHSYANLLEGDVSEQERAEYIHRIKERTDELREMTGELFKYSVSQDPQYQSQLSVEDLDLKRILEDSLLSFYKEFESRGLTPATDFPDGPVVIRYNRKTAMRIFDNLFSNASKYAAGSLTVTLRADGTIITDNPAPDLTPVLVSKMFDKYFTVNDGRNSTGLGLSIARDLISENGGSIDAELRSDARPADAGSQSRTSDSSVPDSEAAENHLVITIKLQ